MRAVKRIGPDGVRWLLVVAFAAAMAWMESATVYYLRAWVERIEPYQPNPLPIRGVVGGVELIREAATLVMLLVVGVIAGRTWRARLGYAAIAFGAWDVLYYVFLRLISGWPRSLLDWDILFLLPLPWWGPVLAPVSIALLMIVWGSIATQSSYASAPTTRTRMAWVACGMGMTLALYVFMSDALREIENARTVLPTTFNWWMFCAALALMATPLVETPWRKRPLTADR